VSFSNQGAVTANLQSISIGGADPGDFAIVSDNCIGRAMSPGEVCGIEVSALPQAAGSRSAVLALAADVPTHPVSLRAYGVEARMEWSATELDFGTIQVNGRSPRQDVQLFNTGDATLVVISVQVVGDFESIDMVPSINIVPPDQAKYFRVWFLPREEGPRTGELRVQCDPPGSSYTINLRGTGIIPA
jgi:hypothetical protein